MSKNTRGAVTVRLNGSLAAPGCPAPTGGFTGPSPEAKNVTFVPGEDFHADHTGKNTIRLNFSNAGIDDIYAGIERLGSVIKQALL